MGLASWAAAARQIQQVDIDLQLIALANCTIQYVPLWMHSGRFHGYLAQLDQLIDIGMIACNLLQFLIIVQICAAVTDMRQVGAGIDHQRAG